MRKVLGFTCKGYNLDVLVFSLFLGKGRLSLAERSSYYRFTMYSGRVGILLLIGYPGIMEWWGGGGPQLARRKTHDLVC